MSLLGRTRLLLVLLLLPAGIITVIFIRWHAISEGRNIAYFDLVGGLALTASFTLALYSWQVARFRQKEAENSKALLEMEIARHKKSEEVRIRLTSIIEAAPDFIGSANADGHVIYLNKAGRKMIGIGEDEDVSNVLIKDTHPKWANRIVETEGIPLAIKIGNWIGETALLSRDGVEIPVWQVIMAHKGPDGAVEFFSTIARDITDRRRLEEELKNSEAKYRLLVEHLPLTVWVYIARTDDIASTVYVGPQVNVLGFSQEEWINGRDFWSRQLHPDDRERVLAEFKRCGEAGVQFSCEYRLLTKFNNVLWFRDQAIVVKDDRGNRLFFQGIMTDITEHKRLEEQLRQSQKMEAVGQLAAGIAHDFNNILTTVTGYAEFLLMKMKEDDPLRNHIKEIAAAGEKGAGLVKSILTFSRKEEFNPIPMDMNEVVTVMKDSLLKLIGEDLELRTELSDESLMVFADAIQMEQMLINIAANARDAMSGVGSLLITASSVKLDEKKINEDEYYPAGTYALVSVSDTGVGMEEEVRKRIFEPFYTTKDVGKGTGLGLSMVYGIIKRHKGFIDVVSEPGRGTTFNIYLPLTAGAVKMKELPATSDYAIERGHTETLLLAEDENPLRLATATYLNELGYNCIEAVNGEDAVARFMENKDNIQLIILDVVMPRKNGKDVYEEIRKVRPDIKVIFSSGYTMEILEQKGIDREMADFIKKPFSPETLHNKIREVLERST